ncbi:hypothetical protein [Novosphingobium sp. JCM 18896]|uniref:hypothetical protein n=1 Tax=Novosphingobium sp. JCM 18896 TaxID=2989731 RepID=UPI002223EC69|nr:hypothetical protein [Novosphingobium sp. JCM 18896]MCW1432126.1 hypothetical protein [Novosphingobium sp. JCM 18896]
MSFPYDGSQEGNGLGLLFDDESRQRINENLIGPSEENKAPKSPLQLFAFLLGVGVVAFVMLYGTLF